ncbi:MAG: hypothetical protein OXG88_02015 [Gammaproteobacteria bacterium]|nr:hypothetical protein [Gammaproteobacteria bacterium]
MKSLVVAIVLLLITVTSYGETNTLEKMLADEDLTEPQLYSWLHRDGMKDATVPTGAIHKLIIAGLQHEDPEIQHCVLSAIRSHVGTNVGHIISNRTITLDRRLQDIPQLYDILIDIWNTELIKAGGVVPDIDYSVTLTQLANGFPCDGGRPAWAGLQHTFAYLYPKNAKVYDIIWNTLEGKKTLPDKEEENHIPLLAALYVGKFNNPKDEAYRIRVLTSRDTDMYTLGIAANSLAKFQSEKGLTALVEILENRKSKWGAGTIEVVEAIMAHGEQATAQHQKLLRDAMPKVFKNRSHNTSVLWIDRELSRLEVESERAEDPNQ